MLFDSHVHSAASPDSETRPQTAIDEAGKKGLGIIFTEHVDYVTPVDKADPSANDIPKLPRDFIANFSVYPKEYAKYRSGSVRLGLEIGLTKAFKELNRKKPEEYEYDFILGSVHSVDGHDIYMGFCRQDCYDDHYKRLLEYFREVIEISDFFDSFAHFDYVSRVSPFKEKNVLYSKYAKEYDAVLSLLAGRGIALEINTSRLNDKAACANVFDVCKRFKELGGKYVTIGSDAHLKQDIGRNFTEAKRIADEAGLSAVSFKRRRIEHT